jgi:hypothetical protein
LRGSLGGERPARLGGGERFCASRKNIEGVFHHFQDAPRFRPVCQFDASNPRANLWSLQSSPKKVGPPYSPEARADWEMAFNGTAACPRTFVAFPFPESASMTNVAKPHIPPLKLRRTPLTAKRRAAGRAYRDALGRLRKAIGEFFRRPTPRA